MPMNAVYRGPADLPPIIPIFPLPGALLLPRAQTIAPELQRRLQALLAEYPVWPHFLE